MAKSKFQKQEEALARKRKHFVEEVTPIWCAKQPGGQLYDTELCQEGKEAARQMASKAEQTLLKAAAEALVDRYGNPLPN